MLAFNQRPWPPLAVLCSLTLFSIAAFSTTAFPTTAAAQDLGSLLDRFGGDDEEQSESAAPASMIDLLEQEAVLDELRLTNAQRQQIETIVADFRQQSADIQKSYDEKLGAITDFREKFRQKAAFKNEIRTKTGGLKTTAEASLRELLSDQQEETLNKKLAAAQPAATAGSSDTSTTPAASTTSSAATAPAQRTADTVASFAAGDDDDGTDPNTAEAADDAADDPAQPDRPADAESEPPRLSFNFVEAPWSDVLRLFARTAGLTLNIRDMPPGSFTYFDQRKYTPTEALDIMNRILLLDGYILVRHDQFLSVFNTKNGVPPNLVETVSADELAERGETELVRVSLPLGDRDGAKVVEEVRALLGPQGQVVAVESANSLVVTDVAANLIKVRKLLDLDRKPEKTELIFKAFPLTQIDATEAADIIRSLLGVQNGVTNVSAGSDNNDRRSSRRGRSRSDLREIFSRMRRGRDGDDDDDSRSASPSPSVATTESRVAVDLRTNSVLVNATAGSMKLVEQMVEALDVSPTNVDGLQSRRDSREPYLEVYRLTDADASEVSKTLSVLHPGMVVNEDGRNRLLHIWATAEKHREIAAHIRQLDGLASGQMLAVLPLEGLNGYSVSATVAALYSNVDDDEAPSVQFDPSGRNLIVRGNVRQIQMVRSMIDQLAAQGPAESSGRTVRIIGSNSASSAFMQQTISTLYPQVTFTIAPPAPEASSDSRSNQTSNDDSERARRIREWRERFSSRSRDRGDDNDNDSRRRRSRRDRD